MGHQQGRSVHTHATGLIASRANGCFYISIVSHLDMPVYDGCSGSRWPTPVPAGSIVAVAAGGLHGATNALAPGRPAAAGDFLYGSLSRRALDARSSSLT